LIKYRVDGDLDDKKVESYEDRYRRWTTPLEYTGRVLPSLTLDLEHLDVSLEEPPSPST